MSQTQLGPPFTRESATTKVRLAENAWNSQDPRKVSLAYSKNCVWRNRSEFLVGRPAIVDFLTAKWRREGEYRLIKELWAFCEDRIAVRFQYEWRDQGGAWFRAYGNENWAFDADGLMRWRQASINDVAIATQDRKFLWAKGPRPEDHPGLLELGL
jgi:nuclear transport factor 2 (NTF2) superfamily protein